MTKLAIRKKIHNEVLQFIEDQKEIDREYFDIGDDDMVWQRIYTNGNCFFLANQIHEAFPQSEIYFREDYSHAVTEVEGLLFDVRGIVMDGWNYVPGVQAAIDYAKCWSHDFKRGWASGDMYKKQLSEMLQMPFSVFQEEIEQIDDKNLEQVFHYDILQAIGDLFDDNDELYQIGIDNGWPIGSQENYYLFNMFDEERNDYE